MSTDSNPLHSIKTFPQLVKYLRDELDWPIDSDDFEELTFDYAAEELGLDAATAVKIKEIKQLRPLTSRQPWGIFFVNFAPKQLPVVALRRILSALVIKKRLSANKPQQAAWRLHDLLFISAYGESEHRDITFAHFAEEHGTGDLPTLRLLGWDDEDTKLKVDFVERELRTKLRWPQDDNSIAAWRAKWTEAFRLRPREVIKTSQQLALQLADLARGIRKRANNVLAVESAKGPLRKMHAAFKEALIHDLTADDFADMYAQTIAYGLLTARISRPAGLVADNLADMVPVTNPFLKDLLETFLMIGGRKGKIDFDELGVNEVVQVLRDTDMEAVLRDFGDRNPQEDPVIHFYELFLKEYDAKKRMQRGVFYTPLPVVSYIVRSVHELLQDKFGLLDGLADTATWGDMAKRKNLVIPPGVPLDEPFVQVLDPATGTGTFLVEAIDVIHKTMQRRWQKQGHMALEFQNLWNDYVPKHLLTRLYGYELLMAPYAIAHMKIGLKLFETGYRFGSTERARIYLTNALEPPSDEKAQREFEALAPALAHEARAVNTVKRHQRFTLVMGNPPYSKMSGNLGQHAIDLIEPFRSVDGERVVEKGALALEINLQDDYVKFWALACQTLQNANVGIGAYITNSRYLASRSLRGMRWTFRNVFDHAAFLDLGGQISERPPDGMADENVFDIEQGVAIGIGLRRAFGGMPDVRFGRLYGTRSDKYLSLESSTIAEVTNTVSLVPPLFRFSRSVDEADIEFAAWDSLSDIMSFNSGCIITSRDNLALDMDRTLLLSKIARFANSPRGDKSIERDLGFSSKSKWDLEACKRSIRDDLHRDRNVQSVLYRPFDWRWIYYSPSLLDTPSKPICESIFGHDNLVMLTPRVNTSAEFSHVLVARSPAEKKACSHDRATQMFPLFRYGSGVFANESPTPNISPAFLKKITAGGLATPAPGDVFAYIYGVLYSPSYRLRYGNALRDYYPRIPITNSGALFNSLAILGKELIALHLLESPKLDEPMSTYIGAKNPEVEKITYARNTVSFRQSCVIEKVRSISSWAERRGYGGRKCDRC